MTSCGRLADCLRTESPPARTVGLARRVCSIRVRQSIRPRFSPMGAPPPDRPGRPSGRPGTMCSVSCALRAAFRPIPTTGTVCASLRMVSRSPSNWYTRAIVFASTCSLELLPGRLAHHLLGQPDSAATVTVFAPSEPRHRARGRPSRIALHLRAVRRSRSGRDRNRWCDPSSPWRRRCLRCGRRRALQLTCHEALVQRPSVVSPCCSCASLELVQ